MERQEKKKNLDIKKEAEKGRKLVKQQKMSWKIYVKGKGKGMRRNSLGKVG